MRRFIFFIILVFCVFCINAQKDVYVLVDLSGTMCPNQLKEAKDALLQIFKGIAPSTLTLNTGDASDLKKLALQVNDRVSINGFGEREYTWRMSPRLEVVDSNNLDNIVNSSVFSITPNHRWTFLTLAKAKIADYARRNSNQRSYILCMITDDGLDDYPSNVYPRFTPEQALLVDKYPSVNEGVNEGNRTTFFMDESLKQKRNAQNLRFDIFPDIKVGNFIPTNQIINTTDGINILIPTRAAKDKPFFIYEDNVKIEWECTSSLSNLIYTVKMIGFDGTNFSYSSDTITEKSHHVKALANGRYEIAVSANNTSIISDVTYIEVNVYRDTKIKISSPVGSRRNPNKIEGKNVNVSWRCPDCDANTTYTISITGTEGNRERVKPLKMRSYSASFNNLPNGKYRITVSGDQGANSDTTYIEVSGGGGGGVLLVLLMLTAIGIGAYFLMKKMKPKPDPIPPPDPDPNPNPNSDDDMF